MHEVFFQELNDSQKEIVMWTEGPVLVLAGAGSGKTRVLTNRVVHLIKNKRVPGYSILAITFTNKATNEMRERLSELLGDEHGVWVYTFHKFCAILLRRHAERLGFNKNFSIYDEDDSGKILNKILKKEKYQFLDKNEVKRIISNQKQKGMTAERFAALAGEEIIHLPQITDIFLEYQQNLQVRDAFDYDDLLVFAHKLLEENPDILETYQNKFKYIHVDEFQDTNKVQNDIAILLSQERKNIFVVGDDDQCIYQWRGAEISNILEFKEVFAGTKVFKLEENYRSTPNILESANKLIQNNKERHLKVLLPMKSRGVRVEYINEYSDLREAYSIVSTITALKRSLFYKNSDFAILVREAKVANTIESKVREAGLPYRMLGGFKFYNRREILDLVAYLRLIDNENDDAAFLRIVNYPKRGIGEGIIEVVSTFSAAKGVSMLKAARLVVADDGVVHRGKSFLKNFLALYDRLISFREGGLDTLLKEILRETAIKQEIEKGSSKLDAETRYENILFFVEQARLFQEKNKGANLTDFIETIMLVPEKREIEEEGVITISTVHAVKGLEFRVVFIAACEEEVFPSRQACDANEVEEERRVMYVAVTRAMERLYIYSASSRFRYGKTEYNLCSRFVAEMQGVISNDSAPNSFWSTDRLASSLSSIVHSKENKKEDVVKKNIQAIKQSISEPNIFNESIDEFKVGTRVRHNRYGEGEIIKLQGKGDETVAIVNFPDLGEKSFIIKLTPMKIV